MFDSRSLILSKELRMRGCEIRSIPGAGMLIQSFHSKLSKHI